MSANNWDVCPRCLEEANAKREQAIKDAAEAYGKVPPEEWRAMSENAHMKIELEETMREDYEIGVGSSAKFHVSYRASCAECGFEFRFKHSELVSLEAK